MPNLKTKHLRIITGIDAKNLWNYKDRGHLIQNDDKTYDSEHPTNIAFIELHGSLKKLKEVIAQMNEVVQVKVKKKPGPKPKEKSSVEKTSHKKKEKLDNSDKSSNKLQKVKEVKYELSEKAKVELDLKKINIKKVTRELQLKDLEFKKAEGSLFSMEKFIAIAKSYSENNAREAVRNMKKLIQDICTRHQIDSAKTGAYILKVTDEINKSNSVAIEKLLKQFDEK